MQFSKNQAAVFWALFFILASGNAYAQSTSGQDATHANSQAAVGSQQDLGGGKSDTGHAMTDSAVTKTANCSTAEACRAPSFINDGEKDGIINSQN